MKLTMAAHIVAITSFSEFAFGHGPSLEEMTVEGRKVNLVGLATSASQGRVSQEELAMRPSLRSGDILEVVPGMVATQHSGSGKASQYFLRGFNLDHGTDFSTSVDAMPVNMRSHGHGQGYTDLNFIIPELIGEIEYRKGAYYADVGDFSGAGSATLYTATRLPANKLSLGIGEDGFARALIVGDTETSAGNLIYGFEHQVYDGPWDDINEDVGKTNLSLKHIWGDTTNQFTINFMAYDNSWNSADQIPERAVEQGIISDLGSLDTTLGGESSRYSLSGSWNKRYANSHFSANVYVINYNLDLWSNFTYFTSAGGDQFQQVDDRMIYGGDFAYGFKSHLGDRDMSNTFGVETRIDDIDEVGLYSSQARVRTGVFRSDAVEEHSVSSYWENKIQWTEHLRTVAGLRYDYFHFDVDPLAAANESTLELNGGTANDDIITGSLSVIYEINPNYESYISIGQGFHSNDARGTTIQVDPTTGDAIDSVDPLVDTLGYEIGLRGFITDKLNASVALWHLDIDSELLFVGDEGTTEDTGVSSQREGIEATMYYAFNDAWALDLEYAYTNARLDSAIDGSFNISGALESVFSAGLNAKINNDITGQLRVRHFDDYPLDGGETADASTVVNLRMGYRVNEKVNLTLDVLNLLDSDDHDVEYYYASQLSTETSPVDDSHYHVFEPRTVRLYASYAF